MQSWETIRVKKTAQCETKQILLKYIPHGSRTLVITTPGDLHKHEMKSVNYRLHPPLVHILPGRNSQLRQWDYSRRNGSFKQNALSVGITTIHPMQPFVSDFSK